MSKKVNLGLLTQSTNVILPKDLGLRYTYSTFEKDIVPKFLSVYPDGIIAFRLNNPTEKTMGNPFSWKSHGVDKATSMFGNWLAVNRVSKGSRFKLHGDLRRKYLEIIQDPRNKGVKILYYKELGRPSHATVIDYLINGKI